VTDKNGIRYFKKGILNFDFDKMKITTQKFNSYPDNYSFPSNLLCTNKGNVFYSFYNKNDDTRTLYLYGQNKFQKICEEVPYIIAGVFETNQNYFILPDELNARHPIMIINKTNRSVAYLYKNKNIPDVNLLGNGLEYENKLIFPALTGFFIIQKDKQQYFIKDNSLKEELIKDKDRLVVSL
ncbi:MAG: hypothetical protein N2203_08900, partial [Bacteroidia bacterium]|nr:hypothetical protein [Bacteroidia bacterium]